MRFCGKKFAFFTTRFSGGGSRQFNHFLAELTARADSQVAGAAAVGMGKVFVWNFWVRSDHLYECQ